MAARFIVGYSGNLGRAHELGIVLAAAERKRLGANARTIFEAEYSQAIAIGKWRGVLEEVRAQVHGVPWYAARKTGQRKIVSRAIGMPVE